MASVQTDFLARVDSIVESNLANENFNIEQLSKALEISYTHTYRKIQVATGWSPSVYIRNKRLDKASQYLIETDLTINQIAFSVGFKTQSYFSTKFSEYKGCSPRKYRSRNTGMEDKHIKMHDM